MPWPPMSELVMAPVEELRARPSGRGGKLPVVSMEKVYGGVPPLTEMVQPE